ncbi:MAG: hypothetical protein SGBAC_003650 [Bacillariaceae sp.]
MEASSSTPTAVEDPVTRPLHEYPDDTHKHAIIVGGGFAGLACAKKLLSASPKRNIKVTILEASNDIGGRVKAHKSFLSQDQVLDLGAEFIHCQGHSLWDWVFEYFGGPEKNDDEDRQRFLGSQFESIFLLSHADGGPAAEPTKEGKYGMYYMDNDLVMYDDLRLNPLNEKLDATADHPPTNFGVQDSVADALGTKYSENTSPMSNSLWQLAVASFGNTAGCCDLSQLSIRQLSHFEHYWEEHEEEGDFRPPPTMGLYGVAKACSEQLKTLNKDSFELILNCEVQSIAQNINETVVLQIADGSVFRADAVVVTVPPPILPKIIKELPDFKVEALSKIGFERAVKVIVKLKERLWPEKVQSIIAAGELIPEMWFRELQDTTSMDQPYYLATGFLVSSAADRFVALLNRKLEGIKTNGHEGDRNTLAGQMLMEQLTKMLDSHLPSNETATQDLDSNILDAMIFDWKDDAPFAQGGYMYPKVGITPEHLEAMAAPHGRLFFAGEATNTNACCTVQAAIETGERAANQIVSFLGLGAPSTKQRGRIVGV